MSTPTTWTTVTDQGFLDWGEWHSTETVSLFVEIDPTAKANFVPGDFPRQVVRAGGFGLGQIGDPLPSGDATVVGISLWWWLEWEYFEVRGWPNWPMGFNTSIWRLRPGVTLHYKIDGV